MYHLDTSLIQRYAVPFIKDKWYSNEYYYEVTVTFNPQYWSLSNAMANIKCVVADILKPVIRDVYDFSIRYAVEYHENGMPHLHAQVSTSNELSPDIQRGIHQRLIRRYGRSQWYQTGQEDKFHDASQMLWSQYIKKDVFKNEENGMRHYFEYTNRANC